MNNLKQIFNKYAGFEFQSSAVETPEFYLFCKKLKYAMQRDIKSNFPNLEISVWSKGHFYISGFITRKNDGAIFYFNIDDVRGADVSKNLILYRSARHLKDYMGGANCYTEPENLLETVSKARYEFEELN